MITPKTTQIFHPSGKLFEAFREFVVSHPDASFFQSDAFFRFALEWPEAEPILLVAIKDKGLKDPGKVKARGSGQFNVLKDLPFRISDHPYHDSQAKAKEPNTESSDLIVGSLLGVLIHEPAVKKKLPPVLQNILQPLTYRTIVYGGPILLQGTRLEKELTLQMLVRAMQDKVHKKSLFTQFRNLHNLNDHVPVFRSMGFNWHDHLNLVVDTSSRETAWMGMSQSRRRQVSKSLEAGAQLIYDPSKAQIDAFYDLLHKLYIRKVKKPLPSRAFFHLLADGSKSIPSAYGKVILLSLDNRIIGGIACTVMENKALYEWYVCGLDQEFACKGIYPSVLLTWSAMEYAAKRNIPAFDFMGLGSPDKPYGVRNFKKKFGGELVNNGRFSMVNRKFLYQIAEIGYRLLYKNNLRS